MFRNRSTSAVFFLVIFISVKIFSQTINYQGPATGSVASGVIISTDNFAFRVGDIEPKAEPKIRDRMDFYHQAITEESDGLIFDNYTYVEDLSTFSEFKSNFGESIELNSFKAFSWSDRTGIPPDPHMAVGPDHIVATINSRFKIFDRDGNELKSILADNFFQTLLPSAGTFDPQIIYDHYENRWFMLWDNVNDANFTAYFLIAYSDDSNPLGNWYTYALPSHQNGSTVVSNWGDFPQVGFDDQAIYISSRQFNFVSGYAGMKIRILNKSELYASNAGPLSWTDLWDIRLISGFQTDDLIPVISYDTGSNAAYFVIAANASNYYASYKITNPLTNPVLTGVNIFVPFWNTAPLANQLGGGTPRIDTGPNGSGSRNAPVLRDGKLYGVHHIMNSQFPAYGSIKYFVIDVNSNSILEQAELGAQGYFYIYPAITVDKDHNIAVTYTRSADTEYAGSFYSTKLSTDPPGLSQSKVMAEGRGNYIVTFGGTRNRWGDYLSAFLDPVNQYNIFLHSQYAAATNQFGTWITEIRMQPYEGVYAFSESLELDFNNVEVSTSGDTIEVILANYGEDPLIITNIPQTVGEFHRVSTHSFPITLNTYDSLYLSFVFSPTAYGAKNEFFAVTNNSTNFTGFNFYGFGYLMNPGFGQQLYAVSGSQNSGQLLYVDKSIATGSNIGPTGFNDMIDLTMHPISGQIYGLSSSTFSSKIFRINSTLGDAYLLTELTLPDMNSIAFDTLGQFYGSTNIGEIYSINLATGSYSLISTLDFSRVSIVFNPIDNTLWGSVKTPVGIRDRVARFDLNTGDTLWVGRTGFNANTNDLVFDDSGVLYGIKGSPSVDSDLFTIDQTNGVGTLVGSVGIKNLTGLGYSSDAPTSINSEKNDILPVYFTLEQNYPNPFNPSTTINFTVPNTAAVTLTVYNILGETVNVLINKEMQTGNYNVIWNADDQFGRKVSSGVYFYELKASSADGKNFNQIRKMVLLK